MMGYRNFLIDQLCFRGLKQLPVSPAGLLSHQDEHSLHTAQVYIQKVFVYQQKEVSGNWSVFKRKF